MSSVWDNVVTGTPDVEYGRMKPRARRVGVGGELCLMPLEDKVGWYLTHYQNRRTFPCLGEACACQRSENPVTARWYGWILALEMPARKLVLASVTHNCWETCEALQKTDRSLRGSRMVLSRKGEGHNGRVTCSVQFAAFPLRVVPTLPFGQRDVLYRIWFSESGDLRNASDFYSARTQDKPGGDVLFPDIKE